MMKYEINASILKKAIKLIKSVVIEAKIIANENGWYFNMFNDSNVSFLNLKISKNAFSKYPQGKQEFSFNTKSIYTIINRFNGFILLEISDNEIILSAESRKFTIKQIEIEEKEEIPKMEWETQYKINAQDLDEFLKDCEVIKLKTIEFIGESDKLKSYSDDLSIKIATEIKAEVINFKETVKSKFSQEHFMKIASLFEKLTICLKNDYPIGINAQNEYLKMSFIVAPIVE